MKRVVTIVMLSIITAVIVARDKQVRAAGNFDTMLNKNKFSLVLFYRQDKAYKQEGNGTKTLLRNFKSASRRQRDVGFIGVNLEKGGFNRILSRYGVMETNVPVLVLFRSGKKVAAMAGHHTADAMLDFINKHVGTELREMLKQRVEHAELKARERRARAEAAWYTWHPGWGYYVSYDPWDPWYYRPYWYDHYYYRPGFGIGFSF